MIAFGVLSVAAATGGVIMLTTAAFGALSLAFGGLSIVLAPVVLGVVALGAALASMAWIFSGNQNAHKGMHFVGSGKGGSWAANTVKSGGKGGSSQGDIYMDGKKVGAIVSGHQAQAASKTFGGQTSFDGSMSLAPIGMNYHR